MGSLRERSALGSIGNVNVIRNAKVVPKIKDPLNKRNGRCLRSQTILSEAQKAAKVIVKRSSKTKEDLDALKLSSPTKPEVLNDIMELDETIVEPMQVDSVDERIRQLELCGSMFACPEYVADIYGYLRSTELGYVVREDVFKVQKDVTGRMRAILVDWLVQVHFRFHLQIETIYLTVNIIDRFLQIESVMKEELQLLGITALWIASKFEETFCPRAKDFVYIADGAYVLQQIIDMEMKVLKALDFRISSPLPIHFLRRISKVADCDCREHTISKYIMELTLIDHSFASWPPSLLAAAASYLSLRIIREDIFSWDQVMVHYSQYREEDLVPFVRKICKRLVSTRTSPNKSITDKYSLGKYFKVSRLPQLSSSLVFKLAK